MPKFASAIDTTKLPVKGLTAEATASAPTSPGLGQLWTDTSVTPKLVKVWDGSAWVPLNIYAGTTAGSYTDGADTRLNNIQYNTQKNVANGYAGLDASTKVAFAQIPVSADNTATASTLVQATDTRLSNQRVPTDGSVTGGTAGTGVKIATGTITDVNIAAVNKDGAVGVPSLRTLGFTSQVALPGNTRLDQLTAPTASVDFNGQRGINVGAPVLGTDLARLVDVQNAAAGIDSKPSVRVRTTSNVIITAPTGTLDGVSMNTGDRVLLNGQTTITENDIFIYNGPATAMTRSNDTLTPNSFVFVEEGSSADAQYVLTNNGVITRGTTVQVWTQFGGATSFSGTANRITVSSGVIDIASGYVGQASITTLGTITSGTWNGTTIAVANGGTGATTAAGARTNLGAPQAGFASTLGAVTAGTAVTVTHNLATQDVIAQVRDASTNEYIYADIINASTSTVTVTTGVSFAAGALRIVVLPVS